MCSIFEGEERAETQIQSVATCGISVQAKAKGVDKHLDNVEISSEGLYLEAFQLSLVERRNKFSERCRHCAEKCTFSLAFWGEFTTGFRVLGGRYLLGMHTR